MTMGNDFSFVSSELNNLSDDIKNQITEVIYSWRDNVESVCVVTERFDCLNSLLSNNVPSNITEAITRRYFVDLESIGTDILRLYIDDPDQDIVIVGFKYNSNLNLVEKKIYKKSEDVTLIDRYNASGKLISSNETEFSIPKSDFLGSAEIAERMEQVANDKNYSIKFLKKGNSNQSYIRVYNWFYKRDLEDL